MLNIEIFGTKKKTFTYNEEHAVLPIDVDQKLLRLAKISYCYDQVSLFIEKHALDGLYFDGITVNIAQKINNSVQKNTLFCKQNVYENNNHILCVTPDMFFCHPTTFIRLSLFWKFTQYVDPTQLNFSSSFYFEEYVWGQWIMFNRILTSNI